ncbi:hypothetical protein Tco_0549324 [Tanacetum coccineum]
MATGKGIPNPLMAGSLPKTIKPTELDVAVLLVEKKVVMKMLKKNKLKKHEVKQVQQSCLGEDCWELCIPDLVPHVRETTTTTQTLVSSQNPDVDNLKEKPVRIIPGPTGLVQATQLRKQADIHKGGDDFVLSTQEYIRKVVEDVGEDEDFKGGSWVSTVEFVNSNGGIVNGCLGDIKNYLKNEKLEQVVAIIKSRTPNVLDDLTVILKDLSGIIHYKVLNKEGYRKEIILGASLILQNVSVFSPHTILWSNKNGDW